MEQKQKGSGQVYIALGIALLVLFAILIYDVELTADMENAREITATMREYIMIMESNGCLTDTQQQSLVTRLGELGVSNITFQGNPRVKVAYGEEVSLSISGTIDALSITGYSDYRFERRTGGIPFSKTIKSTAQY